MNAKARNGAQVVLDAILIAKAETGFAPAELTSRSQRPALIVARHWVMWRAARHGASQVEIARAMNCSQSSVSCGIRRTEERLRELGQ